MAMSTSEGSEDPVHLHVMSVEPALASADRASLLRLAAVVAATHALPRPLNAVLADDAYLQALNSSFRGKNTPTDVLSFDLRTAADPPGQGAGGEIYISLPAAARQARELGVPLLEETARLLTHGLLHLAGYEHETSTELEAMEAETDRLLGVAKLLGLDVPP